MLQALAARFLAWRAQRETVRMLNRLDGATLRDLGIMDIESQVYGAPQDRRARLRPRLVAEGARELHLSSPTSEARAGIHRAMASH